MSIDKINRIISGQSKFKRFQKPLEAAGVCKAAAECIDPRYNIISFKNGLLTVGVPTVTAAANLQMNSTGILDCINQKLGKDLVLKLRYKIV